MDRSSFLRHLRHSNLEAMACFEDVNELMRDGSI